MPADAQVSWHDSTAYVLGIFPHKGRSRWLWCYLMMSLSFCLCKGRGGYIREHTWAQGVLLWFVWFSFRFFLWFILRKPQILSLCYLSASQGVGLLPYREAFFICLNVCVQGYPEHLELVVVYLLVSQPGSFQPCIYLTWFYKGKDHSSSEQRSTCMINHDLREPTKFIQHPRYIYSYYEYSWYLHIYICTKEFPIHIVCHQYPFILTTFHYIKNFQKTCAVPLYRKLCLWEEKYHTESITSLAWFILYNFCLLLNTWYSFTCS